MAALMGLELLLGAWATIEADPMIPPPYQPLESSRRIVEVTQDGDGYVVVDLTTCHDARAIRACILTKFSIPKTLHSKFAIYPIELGGVIIGDALNDEQLLLYHRFAESIPLRFFIQNDTVWHGRSLNAPLGNTIRQPGRDNSNGNGILNNYRKQEVRKDVGTIDNACVMIHSEMPVTEVLGHLRSHGCDDLTSQLGKYEVSEYPVSTGGFGEVYLAKLNSGGQVGLKCMRLVIDSTQDGRKELKRAAHELYIWSKCRHPNILELIGVAEHRGQIAMVSPWMKNGDLRRFLARQPRSQINRYFLCAQIADGVAYLHRRGIAHGDLKGANILMSEDFTPKIIDFGGAGLKKYTLQFSASTNRSALSIRWAAPEIVEDKTGNTAEADVYSLAMTILEVMTGEPPYASIGNDAAVIRRIVMNLHPDRPEECIPTASARSNMLWDLLERCWTYTPSGRPEATVVRDVMQLIAPEGLQEQSLQGWAS